MGMAACLVAMAWLILGDGDGDAAALEVGAFGRPEVPSYAAAAKEVAALEVSYKFHREDGYGWVVETNMVVPNKKMSHEEYVRADEAQASDGGVLAGHVTCLYVVPEGSEYLPELSKEDDVRRSLDYYLPESPKSTETTRVSRGDVEGVDVWSRDCIQLADDPKPKVHDDGSTTRFRGSFGVTTYFSVPESVLRPVGEGRWSLIYSIERDLWNAPGKYWRSESPKDVVYQVLPGRGWEMEAYPPPSDVVITNNPAELAAELPRPAKDERGLPGSQPVYVTMTGPEGGRWSLLAIALLGVALPFLAQGAFRHLFDSDGPLRLPHRSGNPAVRAAVERQKGNQKTYKKDK